MERLRRKKLPHDVPVWVASAGWFFNTITCVPREKNQLCRAGVGDGILDAIKHNEEKAIWRCRLALLMPDHLHAVICFSPRPGMRWAIRNWKKYLALKFGISWQTDFFDHRLRDERELAEKAHYILMNPVRLGLCERAEDWPWVYPPREVGRAVPCAPVAPTQPTP